MSHYPYAHAGRIVTVHGVKYKFSSVSAVDYNKAASLFNLGDEKQSEIRISIERENTQIYEELSVKSLADALLGSTTETAFPSTRLGILKPGYTQPYNQRRQGKRK
ncbi:MAG TPA: hypothetical protein VLI92_01585 [Candidatus Saccharimonadales bacterium]|nr:hypothetical protein [Candidatus Saccharimonadales bacterium]